MYEGQSSFYKVLFFVSYVWIGCIFRVSQVLNIGFQTISDQGCPYQALLNFFCPHNIFTPKICRLDSLYPQDFLLALFLMDRGYLYLILDSYVHKSKQWQMMVVQLLHHQLVPRITTSCTFTAPQGANSNVEKPSCCKDTENDELHKSDNGSYP